MKRILSVILMLTLLFSFAIPVFAEEQEMYSVQVKVHVDGEIKAKGSTLAITFFNLTTHTPYDVKVTKQTSYCGEVKLPDGEYKIMSCIISGFFMPDFKIPTDDRWTVAGMDTTFEFTVGDPSHEGSASDSKEDYSNENGMIDYEQYGKSQEELIKDLQNNIEKEKENLKEDENTDPSKIPNGRLITLKGNFSMDRIRFYFVNEETDERYITTFDKGDEYQILTAFPSGTYTMKFIDSSDDEKYQSVDEKITVSESTFSVSIEKVKEDTESSKPYDDSVPDHKAPSIDDGKTESKFPAGTILLSVLVVAGVVVIIVWKKKRSE